MLSRFGDRRFDVPVHELLRDRGGQLHRGQRRDGGVRPALRLLVFRLRLHLRRRLFRQRPRQSLARRDHRLVRVGLHGHRRVQHHVDLRTEPRDVGHQYLFELERLLQLHVWERLLGDEQRHAQRVVRRHRRVRDLHALRSHVDGRQRQRVYELDGGLRLHLRQWLRGEEQRHALRVVRGRRRVRDYDDVRPGSRRLGDEHLHEQFRRLCVLLRQRLRLVGNRTERDLRGRRRVQHDVDVWSESRELGHEHLREQHGRLCVHVRCGIHDFGKRAERNVRERRRVRDDLAVRPHADGWERERLHGFDGRLCVHVRGGIHVFGHGPERDLREHRRMRDDVAVRSHADGR